MKRIINGRMFDTKTAEKIFTVKTESSRAVNYYIYKTPKLGVYFTYGGGNDIELISHDCVKNILGKDDIESYIREFGEPELA